MVLFSPSVILFSIRTGVKAASFVNTIYVWTGREIHQIQKQSGKLMITGKMCDERQLNVSKMIGKWYYLYPC